MPARRYSRPHGVPHASFYGFYSMMRMGETAVEPVGCGWRETMLWTAFVVLLVLWLLGFSFHVAGSFIHLLLVIALVVLIVNLVTGRSTAA